MIKNKVKNFLYEKESYKIRGACFTIWNNFKNLFKEKIIENALKKELKERDLEIETQKKINIYYKGERVGTYVPDLIVNDCILIEIKVKPFITKEDEKQFWYYLKGSKYKLGFLINFGPKKLEIRRRIYDQARNKHQTIKGCISVLSALFISVFISAIVGLPIISTPIVKAQQNNSKINFSVAPEKFDLELEPGQVFNDKIRFYSQSDFSLAIKNETTFFSATGERGEMTFNQEPEDVSFDARQWFRFEKEQFVLQPGQAEEVKFSINVPVNAETSGYYLVSFFQADPVSIRKESPTTITAKIGALFILNIVGETGNFPSLDKQFEIIELNAPAFTESGPISINFRVQNNDPVHVKPSGKLIIYDFFKRIKAEIEIEEQTILPRKIRFFETATKSDKFWDRFFIGPYRVELILSTKTWREKIGHDRQVVQSFKFFALPWKIILIFLAILLIPTLVLGTVPKKKARKTLTK